MISWGVNEPGLCLIHREHILCKVPGKNPNEVLTVSNDSVSVWSPCWHPHRNWLLPTEPSGTSSTHSAEDTFVFVCVPWWGREGGWSEINTRRASVVLAFWGSLIYIFLIDQQRPIAQISNTDNHYTPLILKQRRRSSVLQTGTLRTVKIKQCIFAHSHSSESLDSRSLNSLDLH